VKTPTLKKIIARIKNNPTVALIIAIGTVVIALSTFTNAVRNLFGTIGQLLPPAPTDISGKWRAPETDKTPLTYFDFKVVGDKLYGTVWIPPSFYMQNGESGIVNGQIIGNRVSFTTKHVYIKDFGDRGKGIPTTTGELITTYKGEIKGNEIHFGRQTEGDYAEITAKKILDLTESASERTSSKQKNVYALVYTLPGHEGGVRSLSFGPDQGRYRSGGLRLVSGGERDGKIRYWDVATAEPRGADHFMSDLRVGTSASSTADSTPNPNEGPIYLVYSPKAREGGVDLTAVGVSTDKHVVKCFNWYFWPAGGVGGGGGAQKVFGAVGSVAISRNSYVVATGETNGPAKFTINIRNTNGDVQRTLNCEGSISALVLSSDGNLLASAEAMESKETTIKMWDTATGAIKWRTSSLPPVSHLAFSPDVSLLASGGGEDGQIRIWDANSGTLRFLLREEQDQGISSLIFSNTGKLLASAGAPSGVIKLWNMSAGTLDHALDNEGTVGALAFSHDDRLLASGDSNKGSIKVWGKPTN
jgi:WD40 repeat protein